MKTGGGLRKCSKEYQGLREPRCHDGKGCRDCWRKYADTQVQLMRDRCIEVMYGHYGDGQGEFFDSVAHDCAAKMLNIPLPRAA